ncbi:MAG TPA: hypothetical protein VFT23_06470 [Burkholderiales bacterium]|nr:hypothetical protein [Burkholderiales bacterium]
MKLLVIGRGAAGHAESWAVELEASLGISCRGESFQIDGSTRKMQRSSFTAAFAHIAASVEQAMAQDMVFCRSRIVLVGAETDAGRDPIPQGLVATGQTYWFNLVALLVLAFPDIHWVFATTPAEHRLMEAAGLEFHSLPDALPDEQIVRLRHIIALRDDGYEPLYDPSGLRNLIKRQSYEKLEILTRLEGVVQCPAREQLALIIDDEVEVVAAIAYLHYRQGYRALTVTTETQLREAKHASGVTRTAESFTIKFPDAGPDLEELRPPERPVLLPQLTSIPHDKRIVYTIDDWRQEARADYAGVTVIRRPFDGMPDLSEKLGLDTSPERFVWPPANPERGHTAGQHAMPGFLTMAARCLLRRCAEPGFPAQRQAMFALEAQELLLNRVPSLSLEAHRQRVCAELRLEGEVPTLFGGSARPAYGRLAPRFKQIEREIDSMLAVIYNPRGERRAQLRYAFGSQLIGTMIDEYRQGYHFHEELATIARQREMDLGGPGRYFAWVLRFPRNFFLSVVGWTCVFGAFYALLAVCNGADSSIALLGRAGLVSLHTLASVGLPPTEMVGNPALSNNIVFLVAATLECVAGLVHWGLGLGHLYTLVSRR